MSQSSPHLVKHADRAATSLYLTLKHVSQGGVQISGSSRVYYMRYSSQNPKPVVHMYPFEALGELLKLVPTL
jgi:hypothetical protein